MNQTKEFHDFVLNHRSEDPRMLALRSSKYSDIDMRSAVVQISGWQVARKKLPLWADTEGVVFPEHLSMEQCSSQATAEYKASVLTDVMKIVNTAGTDGGAEEHYSIADLTGGFGVDSTMLARGGGHLTFVERQSELCKLAENNLPLLGVKNFEVICGDGTLVLDEMPYQNFIYLDPARRDANGRKTVEIEDCTPNVIELNERLLHKADVVMLKLSPMLDLASAERRLSGVRQIHIVSVDGECKEILILLSQSVISGCDDKKIVCANITSNGNSVFSFTRESERNAECHYSSVVQNYLYEPNASVMKAGCFKAVADKCAVEKLHPNSHLYTSQNYVHNFPGRIFAVEAVSAFSKRDLRTFISGIDKANLSVRNFPAQVAELRKRFNIREGGDIYLFATTLSDGKHVMIKCRKVNPPHTAM